MAEQRQHLPHLKVPKKSWNRSFSSHSTFSPSLSSPFISPSPSSSKLRPRRPPEASAWFSILILHTFPLYVSYTWLSSDQAPALSSTIVLSFLVLLGSSIVFLFQPWSSTSHLSQPWSSTLHLSPVQLAILFFNSIMLAASTLLKLEGLRSTGPLVAILGEYAGFALARFALLGSDSRYRIRALCAIAAALLLLAKGWTRESCSPFAIRDKVGSSRAECSEFLPLWAPVTSGVLSSFIDFNSSRVSLKRVSKKRSQGYTTVAATLLLLPLCMLQRESFSQVPASAWWPLANMIFLGVVKSVQGDSYFEERLQLPHGSMRHFVLTTCSACLLDLWFGLDISPVASLVTATLLGYGVRGLADPSAAFSLESIADRDSSTSLSVLLMGPVRHLLSNSKSKKIAAFLCLNTAFMFVEFLYGFTSNSLGLVSDACHMLFDCAALAIGLYASSISKLQANGVFNYGYGRFEVLSGYANAIFLVLVTSFIVLESIERILDPPQVSTDSLLLVSIGGLLVNVVGLIFFHDEHHLAHGGGSCSHSHHQKLTEAADCDKRHRVQNRNNCSHHHHHRHQEEQCKGCSDHEGSVNGIVKANYQQAYNLPRLDSVCQHSAGHHQHAAGHQRQLSPKGICLQQEHLYKKENLDIDSGCQHHHHQVNHLQNILEQVPLRDGDLQALSCEAHGHHNRHNHQNCAGHMSDNFHQQQHRHHQHHHIDHNMRGIFLHVLADTLGSVGVVISTLLIKYKGWHFSDAICSIFISTMIIVSVVPLLRNSAEVLVQRVPRTIEERLRDALEGLRHIQGVGGFERLHIWSLTNEEVVGTLQLHASIGADKHAVRKQVAELLGQAGVTDLTIQVEDMA